MQEEDQITDIEGAQKAFEKAEANYKALQEKLNQKKGNKDDKDDNKDDEEVELNYVATHVALGYFLSYLETEVALEAFGNSFFDHSTRYNMPFTMLLVSRAFSKFKIKDDEEQEKARVAIVEQFKRLARSLDNVDQSAKEAGLTKDDVMDLYYWELHNGDLEEMLQELVNAFSPREKEEEEDIPEETRAEESRKRQCIEKDSDEIKKFKEYIDLAKTEAEKAKTVFDDFVKLCKVDEE